MIEEETEIATISEEQALEIAYNTDAGSQYKANGDKVHVIRLHEGTYFVDFPPIWKDQYGYSVHISIDSKDGSVIEIQERQLVR